MKTLTEYLVIKLTRVVDKISSQQKNLISSATDLNIKAIESASDMLRNLNDEHDKLTQDAIDYLSVADIVKHHLLLHKHTLSYGYNSGNYNSGVKSVEDAQLLKTIGVPAKIKI